LLNHSIHYYGSLNLSLKTKEANRCCHKVANVIYTKQCNMVRISQLIQQQFNLNMDKENEGKTIDSIEKNVSFKGANLWILAFAIMIASIGLNTNSTAVIIGAMLISPLMGPIMGAGLALGINDFELLKRSLKNLLIATIISLITSTLYFLISPLSEARSELLARTQPTIYDVLIAFFGGLAGMVAVTRIEKGNAIPGVAIATALMPPLCTAGYGLATGQWLYFAGAFYLYLINCVFICLATLAIVKYLQYHKKAYLDEERGKKVSRIITIIVVIMIIPSIYLAYTFILEGKFIQNANNYIKQVFEDKHLTVVYKNINYKSKPPGIEIALLNKKLNTQEINEYKGLLGAYGLNNTQLTVIQPSDSMDINTLKNIIMQDLNKTKDADTAIIKAQLKQLEDQLITSSPVIPTFPTSQISTEAHTLFPQITNISIADHLQFDVAHPQTPVDTITVITVKTKKPFSKQEQEKLHNWLNTRLELKRSDLWVQ
jgi:uncharacterized hydrophobic protein (TIGR00271 family)